MARGDTRAGHGRTTVAAEGLYPPCPTPTEAKQPQIRAQRPHQASFGPKGGSCIPRHVFEVTNLSQWQPEREALLWTQSNHLSALITIFRDPFTDH